MPPNPPSVGKALDLRDAMAFLGDLETRARDLRPFFAGRVSPDMTALLVEQFESQGSRMRRGHGWRQLAPSTIQSKTKRGTVGNGILVDSGAMRRAFVDPHDPDAVEVLNQQRYIRSVSGEAHRIAGYHQTGTRRMPARPVMGDGIPEPIKRQWMAALQTYITTGVIEPGGSPAP